MADLSAKCVYSGEKMELWATIRQWCVWTSFLLALTSSLSLAQNRRDQQHSSPRPNFQPRREQPRQERHESRPQINRPPARPEMRPAPQFQPQAPPQREYRPYQPPAQGHHSGQWLNQHREMPYDQQRRALENDPSFRRLPRERQQEFEHRLQRFNSLPPDRQQQVLRRMETWEHLTPQQKQDFRGVRRQFNGLPSDRRQAVRNAIESLRAMPPSARQHEIESGRFSQFTPQERQLLDDASRLPLAPAQNSDQSERPDSGPQRYIPRPPH